MEEQLRYEKRTGREALYPIGKSYVGTYRGQDRMGRLAHFKILYVAVGKKQEDQRGFLISCAALEDAYIDYLVDFEKVMQSLEQFKK